MDISGIVLVLPTESACGEQAAKDIVKISASPIYLVNFIALLLYINPYINIA